MNGLERIRMPAENPSRFIAVQSFSHLDELHETVPKEDRPLNNLAGKVRGFPTPCPMITFGKLSDK